MENGNSLWAGWISFLQHLLHPTKAKKYIQTENDTSVSVPQTDYNSVLSITPNGYKNTHSLHTCISLKRSGCKDDDTAALQEKLGCILCRGEQQQHTLRFLKNIFQAVVCGTVELHCVKLRDVSNMLSSPFIFCSAVSSPTNLPSVCLLFLDAVFSLSTHPNRSRQHSRPLGARFCLTFLLLKKVFPSHCCQIFAHEGFVVCFSIILQGLDLL